MLRSDSFVKRILSSLLFSGVLSIPGNAAATRRNSWKQNQRGFTVGLTETRKNRNGAGSSPVHTWAKLSRAKLDFTRNSFNITRKAGSRLNAIARFRWLTLPARTVIAQILLQTGYGCTPDSERSAANTRRAARQALWAEKAQIGAEDAEFISTLIYYLHSGQRRGGVSKSRVAQTDFTADLDSCSFRKRRVEHVRLKTSHPQKKPTVLCHYPDLKLSTQTQWKRVHKRHISK